MIAYEELCDALARWRSKNGLPGSPSARPMRVSGGMAAVAPPPPPTSRPPAAFVQSSTQEVDPADVDAEPLGEIDDGYAEAGSDDATATAVPIVDAPPKREDSTSEIDIDGLDVVEENDA